MIKTIVFDLDDTLYNERDFVFGAFYEVSKYLSKKYGLEIKYVVNETKNIFHKFGRGKIFDLLLKSINLTNKENVENLIKVYRKSIPKLNFYEDAEEILKYLNDNKYNLALITDGNSLVQWNKIKGLNIKNYIKKIVVTDDYGINYWKPHEKSYLEVMNYFNSKPYECIYIGDNPKKDFITPNKLGWNTFMIEKEKADYVLYEEDNLENIFKAKNNIKNFNELKLFL